MQHSALLRTFTSENRRKRSKKCGDICASEVVGRGDKIVAASAQPLPFRALRRSATTSLSSSRASTFPLCKFDPPPLPLPFWPSSHLSTVPRSNSKAQSSIPPPHARSLVRGMSLRIPMSTTGLPTPPAGDCLCYCAATAAASKRTS